MSSSNARSTTRLSTRAGSSSSASSASAAAAPPLARTVSIPKQRGEKYFTVLKAKKPEGAPRHCLFIVLTRYDQLEPFVLGFSTSRFDGTGFFAYKGHKYIADAETYACDAAAALTRATPADAKAALGALGPRRYIRIDDFASMLSRGENGALAAVKAATEDADVEDEPPASPRRRRARARARGGGGGDGDAESARRTKAPRLSAASPDAPRPPSLAPPPLVNGGGAPVGGGVVPGPAAPALGQFALALGPYSPFCPPSSMPPRAPLPAADDAAARHGHRGRRGHAAGGGDGGARDGRGARSTPSLNVRALGAEKLVVVRRALDELARAGRRPDVVCLQETWGTEASERRFALEGYRLFAFSRGGRGTRSPGGGLATFVRSELRAYTLEKGESGVVVELSDAVPAVHIANVYRSERADRELPVGARFFDFVGGAVDRARRRSRGRRPGSHEARRLHGIIQTEILGRAARATHEWDAVRAADGSVVRTRGRRARGSEWTAELHAERRNDPRYLSPMERRLASCVRWSEVAAAIAASSSATSPSPADGICPPALKCGGMPLELALAAVFDVAMRTGAVPASWRTGYVRWLFKKGDELDPSCFRGIVLTSLVGKVFERVLFARLRRWALAVGAVPDLQAVPCGSVVEHLATLNEVLAARRAAREPTWVMTVDIVKAYPACARGGALGLVLALPVGPTGEPKTFVFVLGPGAAGEVRDYGGRFSFVHSPAREEFRLTGRVSPAAPPDLTVIIPIGTEGRYLARGACGGRVFLRRGRARRVPDPRAPAAERGDDRGQWRAAVGRAAREYAERQAAGVSDLALFRAVRPSREWRRTWILEQRASGDRRETALVAILGGTCRLAPQTRLVRWAARGRGRPGYCDLCGLYVRGTAADMAHVCLECPASRMARLDLDAPRRAWFASVEDAYGRQGREAAARCGGLAELRDDLARAFASTFGEFFVAHASEIAALPPRRST
ncbi:ribonuclease H protein [Aureococcus anophagefferens]|nr:ribonuclease H protein [Aureococcus anophagefferens]